MKLSEDGCDIASIRNIEYYEGRSCVTFYDGSGCPVHIGLAVLSHLLWRVAHEHGIRKNMPLESLLEMLEEETNPPYISDCHLKII